MIEVQMFAIVGIQASRRIQPISLMAKRSTAKGRVDSEICVSPVSHQLLQLQRFPKYLKNLGPSF